MSARTRDTSTYTNPDGTTTTVFQPYLHYKDSSGVWQSVDLTLYRSGTSYVANHHDLIATVANNAVQITERATGKGISWPLGVAPTVSGRSVTFAGPFGMTWTYATTLTGADLSAVVPSSVGARTYSFPYSLVGGSTALTVDADGSLAGDVFRIPAPLVYGADGLVYRSGSWSLAAGKVNLTFDDSTLPASAYPYLLDPSTTFNVAASADDGQVWDNCATYPPQPNGNLCSIGVDPSGTYMTPERNWTGSLYGVDNGLVRWDTSGLPADAVVQSAQVKINVFNVHNANIRALTADYYTAWPISTAAYSVNPQTNASGIAGWALSSLTGGTNTLSLQNVSNVCVGASPCWSGLRFHVSGGTPTGENNVTIYTKDSTGTPPQLVVTYNRKPTVPTVNSPVDGSTVTTLTPALVVNPSTDPEGNPIQYQFQVASDSGFNSVVATSGWVSSTSWTVPSGLADSSSYYWRAQARDTTTQQPTAWSSTPRFSVLVGAPGPPTQVVASAAPGGATLSWLAPASDGGHPITGYTITPYIGATAGTPLTVGAAPTTAEVPGLTPGTAYTFQVRTVNSVHQSATAAASGSVTTSAALPAAAGTQRLAVSVGYADDWTNHIGTLFPSPWSGSPNVNFVGDAGPYDSGAIRIDNLSGSATTVDKVTVDIGGSHWDLWGSNLNVPAQGSLILAQVGGGDSFDTSDVSGLQCSTPSGLIPQVHVTIAGVTTTYQDTGQILNTAGIDPWACSPSLNEGTQWVPIGGPPSPFESMARNLTENCIPCQSGEPIDNQSGNFTEAYADIAIPGRGVPIDFTRAYNSVAAGYDSYLGYGWHSSYDMSLVQEPAQAQGAINIRQENGTIVSFSPAPSGGYRAAPRVLATLVQNGDGTFTFTRRRRQRFVFGATGQLIKEIDLNGYTTTLAYNSAGQLTTITDPAGRSISLSYTGLHLARITDANVTPNRAITFAYNDGAGNLTDVTDMGGGLTHFTYDTNHHVLTVTNPMGGLTTNHYDSSFRVDSQTQKIDATRNRQLTFAYTATQTTVTQASTTDPNGNVTVYTFQDGEPTTVTRASGTPETATWRYTYDPVTQGVASVQDPNTILTTYTYDAAGNALTKTVDPSGLNRQTVFSYDSLNDLLTVKDPKQVTTTMTYDTSGNLKTVSTPLVEKPGQTQLTSYAYGDPTHPGDVTAMTDPDTKTWNYGYDAYGDRASVTDPLADKITYGFDAVGRTVSMVTPRGNVTGGNPTLYQTLYTTNAFGDVLTVTDPLAHQTIRQFDFNRRLTKLTDANAHYTTYDYDYVDELTTVHRADLTTTLGYSYDLAGNLLTQTDGNTKQTVYTYDHQNMVSSVKDPLLRVTTYTYDGVGNLKTVKDPTLRTTTFGYDHANERASITYSDGVTPNVTAITYDADGQRSGMTDGSGTSTYSWNSLHQLFQSTNGAGQVVGYDYDLKGLLKTLTYPGGTQTVTRGYDDAGRLHTVSDWLSHTTTIDYDVNSNISLITYPNGTTASYGPDNADRLMSITDKKGASTLASFTYTRFNANQLKTLTPTGVTQSNETYAYSNLDQVKTVNSTSYAYDKADNLTTLGTTSPLVYDAANELTSSTAAGKATTYTYDSQGNRSTLNPPSGSKTTYTYDMANRLAAIGTNTYSYDGGGLRAKKVVGGSTTAYTWDVAEGLPLLLKDGATSLIYGLGGMPLEQISSTGTVNYFLQDQLGSTRLLTDSTGNVAATYTFDAYGKTTTKTGTATTSLQFAGQYADAETGFQYLRARYYDPATGQFLSRDPEVATTQSPYGYVSGDALDKTDPTGLRPIDDPGVTPPGDSGFTPDVESTPCPSESTDEPIVPASADGLLHGVGQIASRLGYTEQQVRDGIHKAKRGLGSGGSVRNPDVVVDPNTGEIYPLIPGTNQVGDSIGNLHDEIANLGKKAVVVGGGLFTLWLFGKLLSPLCGPAVAACAEAL